MILVYFGLTLVNFAQAKAPHYLIFSAAADAPGQAAGLQVALATGNH